MAKSFELTVLTVYSMKAKHYRGDECSAYTF